MSETNKQNLESTLKNKLQEIAGNNVLGLRSKETEGLVLALNYIFSQYRIAAGNADYSEGEVQRVIENCLSFLI